MNTLIRNGTIVTAASSSVADILVDGETVTAIGPDLAGGADRIVEAAGKLVLPGGVDVHTHLDMPLRDSVRTADDFESGTRAAACGGTTTIVDHVTPARGERLESALDRWMARASGRAVVDFGFHVAIPELHDGIDGEMGAAMRAGVTSFKIFMAYPGRLMLEDGEIYQVLRLAARLGALVCLHAENGSVIDVLVRESLAAGRTAPRFHASTRPAELEAEAVRRGIALAELAEARLYVVHVSSPGAVEAIASARRRGVPVLGETCPQYLFLSDELYSQADVEAAKYIISPPLRPRSMQEALWRALGSGDLQVVATDHCAFRLADKATALGDFSRIPNGAPGIEPRLLLLYQAVCEGRLALERMVDLAATSPAKLFGLWPAKGEIAVGADADLVVLDPARKTTVSAATHQSRCDYEPYEGLELAGAVELCLSRGEIIAEGGRFVGSPGRGRFRPRLPIGDEHPVPVPAHGAGV